ncbi:MAG: heterodisulfide reductase-related iron-sulfur binding cluster, partial [Conexivisphaera sp.]
LGDPLGLSARELSRWSDGLDIPGSGNPQLLTGHMYQLMPYVIGLSKLRRRAGSSSMRVGARIASVHPGLFSLSRAFVDRSLRARYDGYLRKIALLLSAAGIRFSYDPREPYPGTLLYELGYDDEFAAYAGRFAAYLRSRQVSKVITVDPHTWELLRDIYPRYVEGFEDKFEVLHYSELLGGLSLRTLPRTVAYHEPCHFVVRDD